MFVCLWFMYGLIEYMIYSNIIYVWLCSFVNGCVCVLMVYVWLFLCVYGWIYVMLCLCVYGLCMVVFVRLWMNICMAVFVCLCVLDGWVQNNFNLEK